ncbi:MAG: autotransporter-associated beta strand repeat-containing protein, partial [Kiritimatiellae bacterium]|nr:autotransporter-associated beta strand repeat-containing protein [Kiritimatiellia bacterium]
MYKLIGCIFVCCLCFRAVATDQTWNGGGSDSNWSSDDNWGGTVPVAGDELIFDGTARLSNINDLQEDTAFSGITFNNGAGAFTLSGNRLSLGGDLVNLDADTQTLNLDMVLSATHTLNASNGAVVVNGSLSGIGGMTIRGPSSLTLTGSNNYDGVTTVLTNSTLKLQNGFGLGSTNEGTVVENGGWIELSGGVTVDEPLTISGDKATSYQGALRNTGGVNKWNGPISIIGSRIKATSGTIVIMGGITGPGAILAADGAGTVIITNQPVDIGGGKVYAHSPGTKVFAVSNNVWGVLEVSGGKARTDVPNAFPATATLQMGVSYATGSYVDLNGNDQTVGKIYSGTTNTGTRVLTTAEPATLTVNQSDNTILDAAFTGALTLIKTGSGTLTLESLSHAYTGATVVSNGTLSVASGSSLGLSSLIVVTGGTLDLQANDAMTDLAVVRVSDTGTLSLGSGISDAVDKLFVNGVQKEAGTWGTSGSGALYIDDAHFSGTGILSVISAPPQPVWDAEGTNVLISTAENWDGDELPAFDGSTNISFGVDGSSAIVDIPVTLNGLIFNRDADFLVGAGDGVLSLAGNGISAMAPTEDSRTYTISEDIVLIEDQVWSIANNGSGTTTLAVTGRISDGDAVISEITVTGGGQLVLSGSNTYNDATLIETGVVHITHSHALGSASVGTTIDTLGLARLELSGGLTVAEPLTFSGGSVSKYCLRNISGINTLVSKITMESGRFFMPLPLNLWVKPRLVPVCRFNLRCIKSITPRDVLSLMMV